jgi:DNA (cytosine-5)-methyltransferase 1
MPLPAYPDATHSWDCDTEMFQEVSKTPTVWDAIGDLPEADEFDELLERDWVMAEFGAPSDYAAPLRQGPERQERELLSSSLRTVHTPDSVERFDRTPCGETEPISRFHKLDPQGICNTLRAGTASDHGAFTSPRPIHPKSPRCITVREAARLHSYPDWFRFHATKWHGFRQIGNSVPPLLAQAVAAQIAARLTTRPRKAKTGKVGDPSLLTLNMTEAAERYGVPASVIPQRLRKTNGKVHA